MNNYCINILYVMKNIKGYFLFASFKLEFMLIIFALSIALFTSSQLPSFLR